MTFAWEITEFREMIIKIFKMLLKKLNFNFKLKKIVLKSAKNKKVLSSINIFITPHTLSSFEFINKHFEFKLPHTHTQSIHQFDHGVLLINKHFAQ